MESALRSMARLVLRSPTVPAENSALRAMRLVTNRSSVRGPMLPGAAPADTVTTAGKARDRSTERRPLVRVTPNGHMALEWVRTRGRSAAG